MQLVLTQVVISMQMMLLDLEIQLYSNMLIQLIPQDVKMDTFYLELVELHVLLVVLML